MEIWKKISPFDGKKKLSWFSMKAVAFHFDGNLKKNLTFWWKILMETFDEKKKKAQLV